jgi:hypothetical protein
MDKKQELKEKGYIIIDDFYTLQDIIKMRHIILFNMKIKGNMTHFHSKPNFLIDPDFRDLLPLLRLNDINKIMREIFKEKEYHFCSHNDIGLNRIVNWHKDTLNNHYKKYQKTDIWSEVDSHSYEIYKVLIYLQDHTQNKDGLTLIEGSHQIKEINIDKTRMKTIQNKAGSIIIFDQRITHRGQQQNNNNQDRLLISLGFGANNIFTKEFEKGTIQRQNDQNRVT